MNIKSFGCSFIFGSDLADDSFKLPPNRLTGTPSNLTWPALLAQKLGVGYNCYAWPGSGNLQIINNVLTQIKSTTEPTLFIISWSWIDRFDYNVFPKNNWATIMPGDEFPDPHGEYYYKHLHTTYRDKLTSLINVKLAIDTLKQQGHQFIMTYMDDLLLDTSSHTSPAIEELQEYVRPHLTNFEGKTFYEWSRHKGFEISPLWHPLEAAHEAASDLMLKVFDKQKTGGPVQ